MAPSASATLHDLFFRSPTEGAVAGTVETSTAAATTQAYATPQSSGGHFCYLAPLPPTEDSARRIASHRILRSLLHHPRLRGLMPRLLAWLSDDGLTPFMLAIQCKAYQVAAFLLDFLVVRSALTFIVSVIISFIFNGIIYCRYEGV